MENIKLADYTKQILPKQIDIVQVAHEYRQASAELQQNRKTFSLLCAQIYVAIKNNIIDKKKMALLLGVSPPMVSKIISRHEEKLLKGGATS